MFDDPPVASADANTAAATFGLVGWLDDYSIPCCLFITHSWAYAFAAAAALFALWSGSLAMQMRTFVATDTLTQSYFAAYTTSGKPRPRVMLAGARGRGGGPS